MTSKAPSPAGVEANGSRLALVTDSPIPESRGTAVRPASMLSEPTGDQTGTDLEGRNLGYSRPRLVEIAARKRSIVAEVVGRDISSGGNNGRAIVVTGGRRPRQKGRDYGFRKETPMSSGWTETEGKRKKLQCRLGGRRRKEKKFQAKGRKSKTLDLELELWILEDGN
ncbi:hypothetical protein ACLOJK_020664 [Asimina triloba]